MTIKALLGMLAKAALGKERYAYVGLNGWKTLKNAEYVLLMVSCYWIKVFITA